ncbi:pheromone precursor ppg-1-like protein [Echria macrotheca]|uniref:Pheromone ppg-1-like protein n=1 Tax=Echria macrotheca TaxID=438768 RepID=A0AAJ0FDS5_9PEZI|nr:pheromone precursor ppg-1-like protein [Echria macrotheca]
MKLSLISIALVAIASSVQGAATPVHQDDKRTCWVRGQSCWKVKRATEAFTDAIKTSGGLTTPSDPDSEAAVVAKSQIDALALAIAAGQDDPDAFYAGLGLENEFHPAVNMSKRSCTRRGQACWKRDLQADPEAAQVDKRSCGISGQSCWKTKRAAEAVVKTIDAADEESDANVDVSKRSCTRRGQACWKRDVSAEAACHTPGGACTIANRDLDAVYHLARSIVESYSD